MRDVEVRAHNLIFKAAVSSLLLVVQAVKTASFPASAINGVFGITRVPILGVLACALCISCVIELSIAQGQLHLAIKSTRQRRHTAPSLAYDAGLALRCTKRHACPVKALHLPITWWPLSTIKMILASPVTGAYTTRSIGLHVTLMHVLIAIGHLIAPFILTALLAHPLLASQALLTPPTWLTKLAQRLACPTLGTPQRMLTWWVKAIRARLTELTH